MIEYKNRGYVDKLFIDSGAYSFHTGKAKLDLNEYIDYLNSIDDKVNVYAQVDTIPGKFQQPKSKEDYVESAQKSWENYLYMRERVRSPEKLTPVFHFGESFDALRNILDWRGPNGEKVEYMGLSPANDSPVSVKDKYLENCYTLIANSSNPDIKTHLYGYTSLPGMEKLPATSVDSISHRKISGYNKIYVPKYGVISLSDRSRSTRSKSSMNVARVADELVYDEIESYLNELGTSFDECMEDTSMRCAVTMYSIIQKVKEINDKGVTSVKRKKLFDINI